MGQHRYAHLLKYEKKAFQKHVNDSFDKVFHPTDKQRILDASHVFTMTTTSLKPPSTANTSVYVHANPGGKGIERLKDMYKAFAEEQEDRLGRQGGPG
jgi:hypothetical protein